jgi:hypothetical protein
VTAAGLREAIHERCTDFTKLLWKGEGSSLEIAGIVREFSDFAARKP